MSEKGKRRRRAQRGACVKCGGTPVEAGGRCKKCRDKHLGYMKEAYVDRTKERLRAAREAEKAARVCERCHSAHPEWGYTCEACRAELRIEAIAAAKKKQKERSRDPRTLEMNRKRLLKLKGMVYETYGGKCVHCGEDRQDALTIDHVNNDGHTDKLPSGKRRPPVYSKILAEGCPPRYQLLCRTCNWLKHARGGTLDDAEKRA